MESLETGVLSEIVANKLNSIIGSQFSRITRAQLGDQALAIGIRDDQEISEFHWGAGESNLLFILTEAEAMPSDSLLIIEEIENTLHPEALKRFIKYLIEKAEEKRLQTIFTTHSTIALNSLPESGRIFLDLKDKTSNPIHRISPDFAFSMLLGEPTPELEILVEDNVSKGMLTEILNTHDHNLRKRVRIQQVGGVNAVLSALKFELILGRKIIAVIDGDVNVDSEINTVFPDSLYPSEIKQRIKQEKIYTLPNGVPEELLLYTLQDHLSEVETKLKREGEIGPIIKSDILVKDLFHLISERINAPYDSILNELCLLWAENNRETASDLYAAIEYQLTQHPFQLSPTLDRYVR